MPRFPYHLAADRTEPLPPVAELPSIEASSDADALEQLKQSRFTSELGQSSAFLRVVVTYHPDGSANNCLSQQVPLVPSHQDN